MTGGPWIVTFEAWFNDLISNYVWYEPAKLHHREETFRKVANQVYMDYVASEHFPPIQVARSYVFNKLCKIPPDKPKVDWTKKALENLEVEKEKEWQPVTWEKRAEYLNKLQEIIKGSTMMSGVPRPSYKEQAEEGLDRPKNMPPYPITSGDEFYIRQRHIDYIKENYEPRTGLPLDTWIPEEQYNFSYPNKYIMHFLSKAKEILSPKDLKLINVDDLETSYKNILKRIRLYRDELQYSNDKDFIQAKEKRIQMLKVISEDLRLLMETMPK